MMVINSFSTGYTQVGEKSTNFFEVGEKSTNNW